VNIALSTANESGQMCDRMHSLCTQQRPTLRQCIVINIYSVLLLLPPAFVRAYKAKQTPSACACNCNANVRKHKLKWNCWKFGVSAAWREFWRSVRLHSQTPFLLWLVFCMWKHDRK